MSALRRTALPVGAALGAVLALPAAPAAAEAAPAVERTAWFNAASGGGLAAPQPTTTEGDLRVVRAVDTQAFSTLLYRGEGVRASLDMAVREGSAQGTPDVVACPTVGTEWAEGANQPMDAAPEVDCSLSMAYGLLSDDGLTLSFGLDAGFEVAPGTWSIALVPTPGGVSAGPPPKVPLPFALDLQPPAPGAFVLEEAFTLPELPTGGSSTGDAGSGTAAPATGFAVAGDLGGLPVSTSAGTAEAPALDPQLAAPAPAAGRPAVAAPPPGTQQLVVRPAAVTGDDDAGRRLLALLALAGGSAAVGYAAGQTRPGPRLIGGRARLGVQPAVAAAVPAHPRDRPRGIGRFSKPRDVAPRRLR